MSDSLADFRNLEVYLEDLHGRLEGLRNQKTDSLSEELQRAQRLREMSRNIREVAALVRRRSEAMRNAASANAFTQRFAAGEGARAGL